MQTTHTPGPWTLSTDARGYDIVTGANGSQVLKGTMCMVTDARLIAAAPDLLAALRQLVKDADDNGKSLEVWYAAHPHLEAARTAIAKATGG